MKKYHLITIAAVLGCTASLLAQVRRNPAAAAPAGANAPGDYATDIGVVIDAEQQALEQAKALLEGGGGNTDHAALEAAVKEMELSRAALETARKSPDKLPAALAAEEAAYQALLKAIPREYRVSRSRSRSQSSGSQSGSGQPGQDELDQLEMTGENQRYETERQAAATPTQQQREQAQTVDRLKQLAQRQQDLNERLRDLQTALQEARTEQQRAEIQSQLKRLRDEERQMLADVDELRQQMEQSPNASQQAPARQQLEQTHTDVQRATQELEKQSVSEALAAGARAEQNLQNLRQNLRQQTSSQFTQQMRQMRNQARDLADQEGQLARGLESLNNSSQKSLDDSAKRQELAQQMDRQQGALTNLLGGMRSVIEQAETSEPLLSKQLYDLVRHEDQAHTESQLEVGSQLVQRGFLPQAGQAEHAASQNIDQLRQGVERAAESVLGSEADALRYAQKELDDLATQAAKDLSARTNSAATARQSARDRSQTNSQAVAEGRAGNRNRNGRADTNSIAGNESGAGGSEAQANGESNSQSGRQAGDESGSQPGQAGAGRNGQGNRGQANAQGRAGARAGGQNGNGTGDTNAVAGNGQGTGSPDEQANNESNSQPGQPGAGREGGANGQGNRARSGQAQQGQGPGQGQGQQGQGQQAGNGGAGQNAQGEGGQGGANPGGDNSGRDQLRQIAQQLGGGARGGLAANGPITGNSFVDWSDRLRDVEQALDSPDLRNQLATVRERVAVYRRAYRETARVPTDEELRNQVLEPLALARGWVGQELARTENDRSLVPLDRDPVQEKYSDLVRKYYEKLGSAQ